MCLRRWVTIELSERQLRIVDIVKENQPITSKLIAEKLNLTRATLRPDLSILTKSNVLYAKPKVGYFYGDIANIGAQLGKIKEQTLSEIMSPPVTISEKESIRDAIIFMFLKDVGSLFITEDDNILTGVISRKDLLRFVSSNMDITNTPVSLAMTRMPNIVYAYPEDNVVSALKKILYHKIDCIPIVKTVNEKNQKLEIVGRFSKTNATKLFMETLKN